MLVCCLFVYSLGWLLTNQTGSKMENQTNKQSGRKGAECLIILANIHKSSSRNVTFSFACYCIFTIYIHKPHQTIFFFVGRNLFFFSQSWKRLCWNKKYGTQPAIAHNSFVRASFWRLHPRFTTHSSNAFKWKWNSHHAPWSVFLGYFH